MIFKFQKLDSKLNNITCFLLVRGVERVNIYSVEKRYYFYIVLVINSYGEYIGLKGVGGSMPVAIWREFLNKNYTY